MKPSALTSILYTTTISERWLPVPKSVHVRLLRAVLSSSSRKTFGVVRGGCWCPGSYRPIQYVTAIVNSQGCVFCLQEDGDLFPPSFFRRYHLDLAAERHNIKKVYFSGISSNLYIYFCPHCWHLSLSLIILFVLFVLFIHSSLALWRCRSAALGHGYCVSIEPLLHKSSSENWNIAEGWDVGVWVWCMEIDEVLDGIIYKAPGSRSLQPSPRSTALTMLRLPVQIPEDYLANWSIFSFNRTNWIEPAA